MMDAPEKKTKNVGIKSLPKVTGLPHVDKYEIHNERFSKEDSAFNAACSKAGIKATKRQASKWRNQKGLAFKSK